MDNSNQTSLKDLIKTLVNEIEKNDVFMRRHADRVAGNCLRFSKMLGLSRDEINEMYLAGLLHDIGFIFLSAEIVQRRGQLNKDEEEVIKRHPLISEKIISKHPMLSRILPVVRHHHESVDGTGYPDGLVENDIPLGAKILNIVNWFDAKTVARPPEKSVRIEDALSEMKEKAGKRFNQGLAENFIYFIQSSRAFRTETENGAEQVNGEAHGEVKRTEATHISREIIQDIISKYKKDEIELPVLSRVVHEIQEVMSNPTTTVDQLATIIERDAVISVRLIAVANSVIYRGAGKVVTVKEAIPRVGVKETHSIVTTISNKSIYETKEKKFKCTMEKLWLHSLASGYVAKALSNVLRFGEIEKYYFMGLVHDIGKVLLLKAFSDMHAKNESLIINEIMAAIDEAHTSFGGAILRKWGYSETLVRIPLLHEGHDFRPDADREILTINLSSGIANKIGYGLEKDICPEPSKLRSAKLLDVDLGIIEDISEEVKSLMDGVSEVF